MSTTSIDYDEKPKKKRKFGECCLKRKKKKKEEDEVIEEDLGVSSRICESFISLNDVEPRRLARVDKRKLVFKDIQADLIQQNGVMMPILKNVSGVCNPGQLTFIMGPSGVGKTTLLNILTGRSLRKIKPVGNVFVNGIYMNPSEMKKISVYVEKDYPFIAELTVKETIRFSANMRTPKVLSKAQLDQIVEEMLFTMGLEHCQNTIVGSKAIDSCLSKGERKKLAFACEVLTDPPILFCDEPTSGLDSFMSHQVMKSLKRFAKEGKTVVCTVHQPSTSVFDMADNLILLAQGEVVYHGPARSAIQFFKRSHYITSKFVNSPENLMNFISQAFDETDEEYDLRIQQIQADFDMVSGKPQFSICSNRSSSRRVRMDETEGHENMKMNRDWFYQFWYISIRSFQVMKRHKMEHIGTLIQIVIISLTIGSIYFGTTIHRDDLQNFKGFAFSSCVMMDLLFMIPNSFIFHKNYPVVLREYNANLYHPSAYFFAKTLVETSKYLLFPLVFGIIVNSMMSLPITFISLFHYFSMTFLIAINATSSAHAVAAMFINPVTTITVLLALNLPFLLVGGYYISFDAIPIFFKPLAYFSWFRHGYETVSVGYFHRIGNISGCTSSLENFTTTFLHHEHQLLMENCSTGAAFLQSQKFREGDVPVGYMVIGVLCFAWKLIGVLVFSWRVDRYS